MKNTFLFFSPGDSFLYSFNNSNRLVTMSQFAKQNGVGRNKLIKHLRDEGYFNSWNSPTHKVPEGCFKCRISWLPNDCQVEVYDLTEQGVRWLEDIVNKAGKNYINSIKTR